MTISSPEREAKKVKIAVDRNSVDKKFRKMGVRPEKGSDILYN